MNQGYEKRMLVAFVLSFILLMGALYFMPKTGTTLPANATNIAASDAGTNTNVTVQKIAETSVPQVVYQGNVKATNLNLFYSNNLFVTVDTTGGRLSSIQINGKWNRYTNAVSLVLTNSSYFPGDSGIGNFDSLKQSLKPIFTVKEVSADKAILGTVVQYKKAPLEIVKTFSLSSNYQIFETIQIKNNSKDSVRLDEGGSAYAVGSHFAFFTKENKTSANLLKSRYFDGKSLKDVLAPGILTMIGVEKANNDPVITNPAWLSVSDYYFLAMMKTDNANALGRYLMVDQEKGGYQEVALGFEMPAFDLAAGETKSMTVSYYLGPKKEANISSIDKTYRKIFAWPLAFNWFMKPVEWVMVQIMGIISMFVPNWGLVIIILALFIKLILSPLSIKGAVSIKRSALLQPKLKNIQEKYKDDSKVMNEKIAELYKKEGVNPLGGCLPMLLQIPVFFTLYSVLSSSVELRGASFLWIHDLTQPDTLFKLAIPFLPNAFNLLPIIMTIVQLIQMRLQSMKNPGVTAQQQQMNTYFMPVIFLFLFYGMPSGLVLYWTIQNLYSIVEQEIINLDRHVKLKK